MTRRELLSCAALLPFQTSDPGSSDIRKAMDAVRAAMPVAEADPTRPVYHFRPPAQWNNDPNGTIWYKGWHHLFYQHNPFDARWGHMHWGHARSRDLVNWEHLPIALPPSLEKGEEHVFSGAAIEGPGGRPVLFYTSIGKARPPEQWLALPGDDELITWRKSDRNPVLTLKHHGKDSISEWRDPFLFRESGKTYMVCGGNRANRAAGGSGVVLLYEARNAALTEWEYLGPVFEHRDREIINIECPNLFKLGSKWVLLMSPHKPCQYFVGELDLARRRFTPETRGVLDPGASYASNISFDEKPGTGGRCILWLWGRTDPAPARGWNSVMTLPRILSVGTDGFLRQSPAPEFESLRGEPISIAPVTISGGKVSLNSISGDCLEIEVEFSLRGAAAGLHLRCGEGGRPGITVTYDARNGNLSLGKASTLLGVRDRVKLRVFLDKRAVEVYGAGGECAIYAAVDAPPGDLGVEAFASGGQVKMESLKAWPMRPANFDLTHYR